MGGGTFGVDGAAHFYFNKSARDVNLSEAAMLAGLFKAPTKYAPHINLPAARARANVVLDNLVDAGFMTEGQVFGARRNPAFAVDRRDENSPNYYLDYAFDEMRKLVDTFPKSYTERVFVVRTAIDMNVQRAAEDAVENQLRQFGRDYHATQAATVVADLDGGVRAMVGGRDYGASQFNRADRRLSPARLVVQALCLHHRAAERLQAELDRGRRPGLHRQLVPAELWPLLFRLGDADAGDHALDQRRAGEAVDRARRQVAEPGQGRPRQDHRGRAPLRPQGAAARHAVDADRLRRSHRARTCRRLCDLPEQGQGGRRRMRCWKCAPAPATWSGASTATARSRRRPFPASVAADMADMMSHVVSEGTARRAALDGIPTAGKTGTTNAYRDAWFVGYTGNFTCAVWYGNDDYSPTNRMTGGSLPAQTWHDIMVVAHQGVEVREIPGIGMGQKLPPQPPTPPPSPPPMRRQRSWRPSRDRRRC